MESGEYERKIENNTEGDRRGGRKGGIGKGKTGKGLYSSYVALFYRKRLPQQNED
jgi:hypothetical protein